MATNLCTEIGTVQYLLGNNCPYCTGAAQTQSKAPHIYTQCSIPQSQAQEQAQRIDQSVNRLYRMRQVYCPSKVQHVTHAKQLAPQTQTKLVKPRRTIQTYEPKAPSQHHATRFSCSYPGFDQRAEGVQVPPITCSASQAGPQN
ncbi:hypothetical protein J3E69DRAFT_110323 [Trichoderma sp. SZMC 28015]